ncbi:MAG: hypothetical protein M1820_006273 [Bogoriella megaspora]|nr:MAG: hypothetical protein M1820_006273 [Bogoriella megaspora]
MAEAAGAEESRAHQPANAIQSLLAENDIEGEIRDAAAIPLPASPAHSLVEEINREQPVPSQLHTIPPNAVEVDPNSLLRPPARYMDFSHVRNQPSTDPTFASYRGRVRLLARYMPKLKIVSTNKCRSPYSGRMACFDFASQSFKASRVTHFPSRIDSQNAVREAQLSIFKNILPTTTLRLLLVEDLSPLLINLLGDAFQMSPEFFEEHLRSSGYQFEDEGNTSNAWGTDAALKGFGSIGWHRPASALLDSNGRNLLLEGKGWSTQCANCSLLHLFDPTTNIFRRVWDLSSDPNIVASSSKPTPTALEEKATFWTRRVGNCKIVVMLLDPLQIIQPRIDNTLYDPENHSLCPLLPMRMRGPSLLISHGNLSVDQEIAILRNSLTPKSTMKVLEDWFDQGDHMGSHPCPHPMEALVTIIHGDVINLTEVIRSTLEDIREKSASRSVLQVEEHVLHWRSSLNRFRYELARLQRRLLTFSRLIHKGTESRVGTDQSWTTDSGPDTLGTDGSRDLVEDASIQIKETLEEVDGLFNALRAEMAIADSRRGIIEAESVSKLTELAFVFIPLTFAASLFSMQIHQLDSPVPLSSFAAASVIILSISYTMRLTIRSPRVAEFKRTCFRLAREEAGIPDSRPLGTSQLLRWALLQIQPVVFWFAKVLFPIVAALITMGALSTPLILLWNRRSNFGYSAVITVVVLPINAVVTWMLLRALMQILDFSWKKTWRKRWFRESDDEEDGLEIVTGKKT